MTIFCDEKSLAKKSLGVARMLKLYALSGALLLLLHASAYTQQRAGSVRIGILEPGNSGATNRVGCNLGVRQGMRDLSWIEGQNLQIEERHAEFQPVRLNKIAAELVQMTPALIWTHSPPPIQALKQATKTIPLVIGVASDIVEQGIVTGSLSRPGGNITGMELRDLEIMGKRLELLKETIPSASRIAVLVDPMNSTHARTPENIASEARTLKVQLHRIEVKGPDDIESSFATIQADAVLIPESAMFSQNRNRLLESARRKRLPTAAGGQQFAEAGSLVSYGANIFDTCRRSAVFVDKILKGSKPGELPVERPTKFDFVVNLKTAKQIGVVIPPNVLARADRVIR